MDIATKDEVLNFWFSSTSEQNWFKKDPDFDKEIRKKFLQTYKKAKNCDSFLYDESPEGALAQIILLDQFPRNLFRDSPLAFISDSKAQNIARNAIKLGAENKLNKKQLHFLYMPFMHSENIEDQEYCVNKFSRLGNKVTLEFAKRHRDIIKSFSRFPHRNNVLNRKSTDEEIEFLKEPNSSF